MLYPFLNILKHQSRNLLVFFVGLLVFFTSSCEQGKKSIPLSKQADFMEHISYYTDEVISTRSPIVISFVKPVADTSQIGQVCQQELFEFSPKIQGQATWLNVHTILFTPEKPLPYNSRYVSTVRVGKLLPDLPEELQVFSFPFRTKAQSFNVSSTQLERDPDNNNLFRAKGNLRTSDYMDEKDIEKLLTLTLDGKQIHVNWQHGVEQHSSRFFSEDILRTHENQELLFEWNGKSLGLDFKEKKSLTVPSKKKLLLLNVETGLEPRLHATFSFSDNLPSNFQLHDKVSISGGGDFSHKIEENKLILYPQSTDYLSTSYTVSLSAELASATGLVLGETIEQQLFFCPPDPKIKTVNKGNILPQSSGLCFPFQAINLRAVELTVVKVFSSNIGQFLQVNELDESWQIKRVGRPVLRQRITLENSDPKKYLDWTTHSIDLSRFIDIDPGAIYRIQLSFKPEFTYVNCTGQQMPALEEEAAADDATYDYQEEEERSSWDYSEDYYNTTYYSWEQRNDPCSPGYYNEDRWINRNLLATDLGLIAKQGKDDALFVAVSNISTTQPMPNVDLHILNYQGEIIGRGKTNGEGMAKLAYKKNKGKPFLLHAERGKQHNYLKIASQNSLSLTTFDVAGQQVEEGLKGFIYGERGVWRPGDSIYLSFILEDVMQTLPEGHPIVFELYTPLGTQHDRITTSTNASNLYVFRTTTNAGSPTGNWRAKVHVGGVSFEKTLQIESVKPNRLKINLELESEMLHAGHDKCALDLEVKWLHGAVAKNLNTSMRMNIVPRKTSFSRFSDYAFEDLSRSFSSSSFDIFEGTIDAQGKASVVFEMPEFNNAPGMLSAHISTKVQEKGGDYSIDRHTIACSPYPYYLGVRTPKGDKARGMLLTDVKHEVNIASVDENGQAVALEDITVELYKVRWQWWWEESAYSLGSFSNSSYTSLLEKGSVKTDDKGLASYHFEIKYPDWGRYYIRVSHASGHASGKIMYIDWPGWAGRAQDEQGGGGASMLFFSTDKTSYKTGEEVSLTFPSGGGGRALLSIENGSKQISAHWIETTDKQTVYKFKATAEMTPNVYLHLTLLQPHAQTVNDRPIRMYGISPINVYDPNSLLKPKITMPDEIRPEHMVELSVEEENGRDMYYTVAIVDEGLLGLTRFGTPNPWTNFNAREALGIRTWDSYDYIMGAYGGRIESLFAIGGSDEGEAGKSRKDANRFKPVVKFMGPFYLKAGQKNSHNFSLPSYIGQVRTMVVARREAAYGKTDKQVYVKEPLMLLSTMPRTLGPGESCKLPISLFVGDDQINEVKLSVHTSGSLQCVGESTQVLAVDGSGEYDLCFETKALETVGTAKITVEAIAGKHWTKQEIELNVRPSNPSQVKSQLLVLKPGETVTHEHKPHGIPETQSLKIECSTFRPINMSGRLKELINYPHGCLEQTTSKGFPLLFLPGLTELEEQEKEKTGSYVNQAIQRIYSMQLSHGGFSYWPGESSAADWASSYAGHFLLEAKAQGYYMPFDIIDRWVNYQRNAARRWQYDKYDELNQTYRLYTLALAGKGQLSQMNQLREYKSLGKVARWRLAAAYALMGQHEVAEELLDQRDLKLDEQDLRPNNFGSIVREQAMLLELLIHLKKYELALPLVKELSDALSSDTWLSTQSTAYALVAMSKFAEDNSKGNAPIQCTIQSDGKQVNVHSAKSLVSVDLKSREELLKFTNTSTAPLYISVISEGIEAKPVMQSAQKGIELKVNYYDMEGEQLDPTNISHGTDFIAQVKVYNRSHIPLRNVALTQIFPSGWEIITSRLDKQFRLPQATSYVDIRDDRIMYYFDLHKDSEPLEFNITLNAAYVGEYVLPAVFCAPMYDHSKSATHAGSKVSVSP